MEYQLPTDFDLIVVGTGMVQSIVSAAASRIGKTVLHIDSNSYYGGLWASFNLDAIQKLDKVETHSCSIDNSLLKDGEQAFVIGNDLFGLKNFSFKWHIPGQIACANEQSVNEEASTNIDTDEQEKSDQSKEIVYSWTQEELLKDARKFNIDLSPRLHFARGEFVDLLISSNIARYSEFRSVSRVMTVLNGQLEPVPCSRSDIFANNKVSVIEKRMLMQLVSSLDKLDVYKDLEGNEDKTFLQYLKERKLTPNLIHYVLYSISMSSDHTPCMQGIESTNRFMYSLGRFGKTPFLFSMYGSGEVPQQFCRLSAVFGGIYALNYSLNGYIFNTENRFQSLVCGQQRINAPNIVIGIENAPEYLVKSVQKKYISRAIFLTDRSILESEKEHLTLLVYPPENGNDVILVIELGMLTGTCPKGLYLVHLMTKQKTNPKDDFKLCIQHLFGSYEDCDESASTHKPKVLCSVYFSLPDTSDLNLETNVPDNVHICPGPDFDLDYDKAITTATHIFSKLYPDLEFLPRAPDPEEIVIGDETEDTQEDGENGVSSVDVSETEVEVTSPDKTKLQCASQNVESGEGDVPEEVKVQLGDSKVKEVEE